MTGMEERNLQQLFVRYLKRYIKELTEGRQEFFLSICDMEEGLLDSLDDNMSEEYVTIVINKKDYSEAVRLRNDFEIKRIVLMSGEGVQQIDSLKDFNEYSVCAEDKNIFWPCIEDAFQIEISRDIRDFLDILLREGPASFLEFFRYLYSCIDAGQIKVQKLNRNLSSLGIWHSEERRLLTKGRIRSMIKKSKEDVVERQLTRALMSGRTEAWGKSKGIIESSLAKGEIKKIIEKVPYSKVEESLKGITRDGNAELSRIEETAEDDEIYSCSYEYKMREQSEEAIEEIETLWLKEREEEEGEPGLNWSIYNIPEDNIRHRQIQELKKRIAAMNLPENKIELFQKKFSEFVEIFEQALPEVKKYTPICLHGFCNKAEAYTQKYFELLSYILSERMLCQELLNSEIISRLETLFCKIDETKISMPFYHPVNVVYYTSLKRMYEYIGGQKLDQKIRNLEQTIFYALLKKQSMQFPIEFISGNNRLYALDYTTVWNKGKVEFTDARAEVTYSALDFRVIEKQITGYLSRNPLATEITIALVEISNLNGLPQTVEKILHMSRMDRYNIGRVNFWILSSKEELLKKQLSQMWDTLGTEEKVRFRFGRNQFYGEKGYDVRAIIAEADMTVFADSSVLYYESRMEQLREGANPLRNRLMEINIREQIEHYYIYGESDIAVLWDTLQHAERSREEGFWFWKSQEINGEVLAYINQAVSEKQNCTIVVLSSNDNILNEIHNSRYIQAHRRKYNGKNITVINFAKENMTWKLPLDDKASISYSLSEFYDTSLDIENIAYFLSEEIKDITMELYWKDVQFHCIITLYREESGEEDGQEECDTWIHWQFEELFGKKNVLGRYFSELWMNQWVEGARSVPAALMAGRLRKGAHIEVFYDEKNVSELKREIIPEEDCMEAVKIQEILSFADKKAAIDSRTVQEFRERYDVELLDRILGCDQGEELLETELYQKLLEIQKKIGEE